MNKVYLLYEDDYGGMFSPYILTAVYPEDQYAAAEAERKKKGWLAHLVESTYNGLNIDSYPKYRGGLFSDD